MVAPLPLTARQATGPSKIWSRLIVNVTRPVGFSPFGPLLALILISEKKRSAVQSCVPFSS